MRWKNRLLAFFKRTKIPYIKAEEWSDDEVEILTGQLLQTINWTERLATGFNDRSNAYAAVFRQTNPVINEVTLYDFQAEYMDWSQDIVDHKNFYTELLSLAIRRRPMYFDRDLQDIAGKGRILTFETDISTRDGAAEAETKGFVDLNDVPPIDTWFYLKNNYKHSDNRICAQALFCWIPKRFEEIMQAAIDVEILDSYRWLDENDPMLYDRIISKLRQ